MDNKATRSRTTGHVWTVPPKEGYRRATCKKCGQDYHTLAARLDPAAFNVCPPCSQAMWAKNRTSAND